MCSSHISSTAGCHYAIVCRGWDVGGIIPHHEHPCVFLPDTMLCQQVVAKIGHSAKDASTDLTASWLDTRMDLFVFDQSIHLFKSLGAPVAGKWPLIPVDDQVPPESLTPWEALMAHRTHMLVLSPVHMTINMDFQ